MKTLVWCSGKVPFDAGKGQPHGVSWAKGKKPTPPLASGSPTSKHLHLAQQGTARRRSGCLASRGSAAPPAAGGSVGEGTLWPVRPDHVDPSQKNCPPDTHMRVHAHNGHTHTHTLHTTRMHTQHKQRNTHIHNTQHNTQRTSYNTHHNKQHNITQPTRKSETHKAHGPAGRFRVAGTDTKARQWMDGRGEGPKPAAGGPAGAVGAAAVRAPAGGAPVPGQPGLPGHRGPHGGLGAVVGDSDGLPSRRAVLGGVLLPPT